MALLPQNIIILQSSFFPVIKIFKDEDDIQMMKGSLGRWRMKRSLIALTTRKFTAKTTNYNKIYKLTCKDIPTSVWKNVIVLLILFFHLRVFILHMHSSSVQLLLQSIHTVYFAFESCFLSIYNYIRKAAFISRKNITCLPPEATDLLKFILWKHR